METYNKNTNEKNTGEQSEKYVYPSRSGRALAGIVIIAAGSLFLGRELGAEIPGWVFSWPMFLIAVGVFMGAKHSFRGFGWLIPIVVGVVFLTDQFFFTIQLGRLMWPIIIILVGLMMIFKPRRWKNRNNRWEHRWRKWEHQQTFNAQQSSDDYIDATTIFGGTKKNIITKDFKGGDMTTFFGGAELNFMQADLTGKAVIDITQIFGGTKLVVPPHWTIKSDDLVCIFGNIEDKRPIRADGIQDDSKVLVLSGTCIFGGIDIKSY